MDVLVTGSSGFIGSALLPALAASGHRPVRALRRDSIPAGVDAIAWDPEAGTIDRAALEGIGAIVNLAGAGIGDKRWTAERKKLVLESRTRGTSTIAEAVASLQQRPSVLVSGSAVGYYGHDTGDTQLDERAPAGTDFLAEICRAWEAETAPAAEAGVRVVTIRTGIVLGPDGGVLKRLMLPFKAGIGGRLGSGKQWMSWISLPDQIRAILHALRSDSLHGAVNLTAPNPVRNSEFTKALARAVHRPAVIPTPLLPLRKLYGDDLVEEVLLANQRVVPRALEADGFQFQQPTLGAALEAVLG